MPSAVVVGAGIGGLAVAGALVRTGWQVTLLEQGERLRPGRAGLLLWPNGVRALHALGLADGLDAIATPVHRAGLRRPDGQWLRRAGAEDPEQVPLVVHRADLHDTFIAGLSEKLDIRTGVTVRTVRAPEGDQPAVGDGKSTWEADLVVAADGPRSAVRQRLAPASQLVSGGYAAWRAVIPWFRAPNLPPDTPAAGETIGVGHRFSHASLGERRSAGASSRRGIYWVATAPGATRPEPLDVQLGLLRRWFAGWHDPIGVLLEATDPQDLVQDTVAELRPVPESLVHPTGTGGYVLIGDAAHAIADHLGQGGCLALEDAATLQALVRGAAPGPDLVAALHGYQQARRARAVRLGRQSRRVGTVLQASGRFGSRARGLALQALAPRLLHSAAVSASQWQPPGQHEA
jgi:2-polyprenyl-6-methoxyphenol hydroxylase-like FAD-dependent oxidoreductase